MARPILDDIELEQVQKIDTDADQVLARHGVPALEGDFLQGLGRRATQITLSGVLVGPESGEGLKNLRDKFRAAEPVPFVYDITTATRVDEVLIEEMGIREVAGKPERFEYALTLREYIEAPPARRVIPPPPPPPPPPVDTGILIVEVIVEGRPDFDFSTVTVTVKESQEDDTPFPQRTLKNRIENIWTEEEFPPGSYTVEAVVTEPEDMRNSEPVVVRAGQKESVLITLRPGRNQAIAKAFLIHFRFDKAFIEPCMRMVLKQVAEYAQTHTDEKLIIVGHTDLVGSDSYNQSLSERRARSAFAYLTVGQDRDVAMDEWKNQRKQGGGLPSIRDTWGTRQYQYILQDLGYYPENVDGIHGSATTAAVQAFQGDHGLAPTGFVNDQTWEALIEEYLNQDNLTVAKSRFLPNCPDEILKWHGCSEQDPVRNTQDAWRPNRRTEFLFVKAEVLPCEIPKPDTFNLPSPGVIGTQWCLGPGNPHDRCCFTTREAAEEGKWLIQPAEPGTIIVPGSIKFGDGTPAANVAYLLIAPDGEFMDGERPNGPRRGEGIPGRTNPDGTFAYPEKPKSIGVYTLEINGPYVARLAEEPITAAKGNVVCKRLDGTSDFDVIVLPGGVLPATLEFVDPDDIETEVESVPIDGAVRLRADVPGVAGDEITVEISSTAINFLPPGTGEGSFLLAFVDPGDSETEVDNVSIGSRVRLRVDATDVASDELIVEISSHPAGSES